MDSSVRDDESGRYVVETDQQGGWWVEDTLLGMVVSSHRNRGLAESRARQLNRRDQ